MEPAGKKQRMFRYILLTFLVLMVLEFSLNIFGFASFKLNSSLWRQLNQSRQLIDEITHGVQNLESLVNEIHPQSSSVESLKTEQKQSPPQHPQHPQSASPPLESQSSYSEQLLLPRQSHEQEQQQPQQPGKKSLLTIPNSTHSFPTDPDPATATPLTATLPPLCPDPSPKLVGMLRVSKTPIELSAVERLQSGDMLEGGLYRPQECAARHRVAIIIPFRDREEHLHIFLNHLLPILKRQLLEFRIYVVDLIPGVHLIAPCS